MKKEVQSAVDFLTNILRSRDVGAETTKIFNTTLQMSMCKRYLNHWFEDKPCKGSGYRCIRFNHCLDPLVRQVGVSCGIEETTMATSFPKELTMWIDPKEVSYRIGENGSVGVLYSSEDDEQNTSTQSEDFNQDDTTNQNSYMSCKEQFWNALPSLSGDSVNYSLATLVSS